MKLSRLSILIPVFNEAENLAPLIRQIIALHLPAAEIIVVDDGSTDGSAEAAMAAGMYQLDNLTAIVDQNRIQLSGFVRDLMDVDPLGDKFRAFKWHVVEIDGHDLQQVYDAIETARTVAGQPTVIIAHTVKGKGVSFMENNVDFHGKAPNAAQVEEALKELA